MIVKEDRELAPSYVERLSTIFGITCVFTTFDRNKAKHYGSISEALYAQSWAEHEFPGTKWDILEGKKIWAKGKDGTYGWRTKK